MTSRASRSAVKFLVYDRSGFVTSAVRSFLPQLALSHTHRFTIDTIDYNPEKNLANVVGDHSIDAIVSPGNSYGFLNGGFDAAISSYYSGQISTNGSITSNDITLCLQDVLLNTVGGYNPVSNALVVNMNDALLSFPKTAGSAGENTKILPQLIHTPTMSLPSVIPKASPVIFNCMWNIICAIERNNATVNELDLANISRVLLPGLGTGVGGVTAESCALQIINALKLFNEAEDSKESGKIEKSYIHAAHMDRQISRSVGGKSDQHSVAAPHPFS